MILFHKLNRSIIHKIAILLGALAFILLPYSIYESLISSPIDYKQGETVRIMYVHVPSAWISLGCYSIMSLLSAIYLIKPKQIISNTIDALTIPGMIFAINCLITGAIWGKSTWGTWWVWDARLTSMLVLAATYVISFAIRNSLGGMNRAKKARAVFTLIGGLNIPIVKFSVDFWNTLHQKSSLFTKQGSSISIEIMHPLLLSFAAFSTIFACIFLLRLYKIIDTGNS